MATVTIKGRVYGDVASKKDAKDPTKPFSVYAEEGDEWILQRRYKSGRTAIAYINRMLESDRNAGCVAAFGLLKRKRVAHSIPLAKAEADTGYFTAFFEPLYGKEKTNGNLW